MKAKLWADRFNQAFAQTDGDSLLEDCLHDFLRETTQLIQVRTKFSTIKTLPGAIRGVVREQKQKWHAICRLCPRLVSANFTELLDCISEDLPAFDTSMT